MEPSIPPGRTGNLVGKSLGPYRILQMIGHGGMATVYKAVQPNLNREVAVKVLHPHFMLDAGFEGRFQKEAETIARLSHPNILPVFDYGHDEGVPFIVMPLVVGGTLH